MSQQDPPSSPAARITHEPTPALEPFGLLDAEAPPQVYGVDDVALMARDPFTLFVHWEITPSGGAAAVGMLGEEGELALRLYVVADRHAPAEVVDHVLDKDHGHRYLAAPRPGALVSAALGLRARDGRFAAVAAAPRVKVPYAGPGTAEELEWVDVPGARTRGAFLEPPTPGRRTVTPPPAGEAQTVDPAHDDMPSSPWRWPGR